MFEKKIKPILQYIGAIGATIMSIMYMVVVVVLIVGFEAHNLQEVVIFAIINAIVGLIIMMFLKIQGVSFAKNLPENMKIIIEYYNTQTKDKKLRTIKEYFIKSTIRDVLIKGISIIVSTSCIIYIVIQGSNDYSLLLLAVANLLMFICFGLLALNSAYEFYNNYHVPYMKDQLENRNKIKKGDIDKCLQSMENNLEILKNKF